MRKTVRSRLAAGVLVLAVVALGTVIGGDVVVKEGTLQAENVEATAVQAENMEATGVVEGQIFKSTGCTATGTRAVAFGMETIASGDYSFAAGGCSVGTGAIGKCCVAMGYNTKAIADYATAFGRGSTNNVTKSFTVGYGGEIAWCVDFRVESGLVTVGNLTNNFGNLYVGNKVYAKGFILRSAFYDKDIYGKALDYIGDCSKTIKITSEGQKEYNHESDPEFLNVWITLTDYDKYTDTKVWNEKLQEYEPERVYQTHKELGTELGMQVAWLRQCVYELKQENEQLKTELAAIKAKLGI